MNAKTSSVVQYLLLTFILIGITQCYGSRPLLQSATLSGRATVTVQQVTSHLRFQMYINSKAQQISLQYSMANNLTSPYIASYTANVIDFKQNNAFVIMPYDNQLACFNVEPEANVFDQDHFKNSKIAGFKVLDGRLTQVITNVTVLINVPFPAQFTLYVDAFTQDPVRLQADDGSFDIEVDKYESISDPSPQYFKLPQGLDCSMKSNLWFLKKKLNN